jgi:membrane protease YdiL (CAAX protease family)
MSDDLAAPPPPPGYWRETRQPVYSAVLVLPFLLVYEIGLLVMRSDVINGGDAVLLNLGGPIMRLVGLQASIASVVVLVAAFIIAQVVKKGSWKVQSRLVAMLFGECLLYAALLFLLLGCIIEYLPPSGSMAVPAPAAAGHPRIGLRDFVLFCGAGVYEELVFRVLLLGLLLLVFNKLFHMEHAYAAVWAVVAGAVVFAAFHHIGGEPIVLGVFLQRVLAGLYFSAIYYNRSFGVAAASHALYDILVGLAMLVR